MNWVRAALYTLRRWARCGSTAHQGSSPELANARLAFGAASHEARLDSLVSRMSGFARSFRFWLSTRHKRIQS